MLKETIGDRERRVDFYPAYDKRHAEPKKNYGVHGVTMTFSLVGPEGAVALVIYTNWQLSHVQKEHDQKLELHGLMCNAMPADLGYHVRNPAPSDREYVSDFGKCQVIDGDPCRYDGSGLQAEDVFKALVEKGEEGLWNELTRRYDDVLIDMAKE